ncbi:RecQ family ATP-dependent DNA helicase [Paraflavisolibacter sp. H34]|uniref:RecQ family ATP-dependent DNA helicase n=1 Tax=Huijunlia imazamoxiresistens TaxID=3127457 RepID=UPI003018B617
MRTILFFDLETDVKTASIADIGALKWDGTPFHDASVRKFLQFASGADFICGHNILNHDLPAIRQFSGNLEFGRTNAIDTLFLSPLLFPTHPYHRLLKDEKLFSEEQNNPVNDCRKARDLFYDEVAAFQSLEEPLKTIYFSLLHHRLEFSGFFRYLDYGHPISEEELERQIRSVFQEKICERAPLTDLLRQAPIALAYCLSLVHANDRYSITPPWVLHQFPDVERVLYLLRGRPCLQGCSWCRRSWDPIVALQRYFGYADFRRYGGQPLQENAVRAALDHQSLLAVFPTGGGKSLTFQIPALLAGNNTKGLTVVISPLQSLMKDQVDNLLQKGISDAVTINGLLDPIERQQAIRRVEGLEPDTSLANILYISPESLRSVTIERLLLGRKIARFVIDEAHCFSSWGQDFRVDYLYIGDFIKSLQLKKGLRAKIPVSCFTATARQKVVEDICAYFKEKLDLDLKVFRANATRTNLHYKVFERDGEEEKYAEMRRLLAEKSCPSIIYVSRTRRAYELARRLSEDGFAALAYHGKMDKEEKVKNQDAFINGDVSIMVATSAFGMGVDKEDVGLVIHYNISDSLENYVQEAGRAGRSEHISADCYVLFSEEDLDKHFLLLNQSKVNSKEINQVWKGIKELDQRRGSIHSSALEIARKAGWDDSIRDIETRVTTAIAALEEGGYVKRGQNMPQVFASSILSRTAQEAIEKINASDRFAEGDKEKAHRVIKKLFSSKSKRLQTDEAAESRVDYMADHLGLQREEVIRIVNLLRDEHILANTKDLTAFIKKGESSNRSQVLAEKYRALESFLFSRLEEDAGVYNLKELLEKAREADCRDVTPNKIKTILNFWCVKSWVKREYQEQSKHHITLALCQTKAVLQQKLVRRHFLSRLVVDYLYGKVQALPQAQKAADEVLIEFSVQELKEAAAGDNGLFQGEFSLDDIEDTLYYLSQIEAIKIEGGFLVIYQKLTLHRLEKSNFVKYKQEDYRKLAQFYESRMQQIHIVGEYARKMQENYGEALQFVDDYFRLNYTSFLNKYFPGNRQQDISRTLTPAKFRQLFASLSLAQHKIILDKESDRIVVAAGPGSGKTRVLVHKLASLLLTENVKHEQLLMLTFSRAAATEFKKRLLDLIGNAAHFVEIKTFHSYCFDLLGQTGSLAQAEGVIRLALEKISNGDIDPSRITKTVLVVDEAQDMNEDEYRLVQLLRQRNEELRVIFVGDDDQNIYAFRGSDARFLMELIREGATKHPLLDNYRSGTSLVAIANQWAQKIPNRLKELPIRPVRKDTGGVRIVQYKGTHLITPLVEDIRKAELSGSTCVLTKTNDEAVHITGLLVQYGFAARLIQSNEGFPLYNLKELRFFTDLLNKQEEAPVISEEDWATAKDRMYKVFRGSNKREGCFSVIKAFESIHPEHKYRSDWKTFLMESRFEDFLRIKSDVIYVSTIHKAKGKEFDNVFMLLNRFSAEASAENLRLFYVGLTRAKNNLFVHYNGDYLKTLVADNLTYSIDVGTYEVPEFLSCVLSHNDVNLGYFKCVQRRIEALNSGDDLGINEDGLVNYRGELVVQFSKGFKENMERYSRMGYRPYGAKVNFCVWWKGQGDTQETQILLPELVLKR